MRITVKLDPTGADALALLQALGVTQGAAIGAALRLLVKSQELVHDGEITFLNHKTGTLETIALTD